MTYKSTLISKYINDLTGIFKNAPDKHEAHYRSRSVLEEMSASPEFLTAILEQHLRKPGTLNTRNYPVVSLNIELNPYIGVVANCWIPLSDRETGIATKCIHHHGNMLLTTATAYGPGYEHWTFKRPEKLEGEGEFFSMKLDGHEHHPQHHVAFVDSYIAHVPFFPSDLTITLALWSNKHPTTWKDHVKRMPLVRGNEEKLRGLAGRLKLSAALDLKVVEYFDFYPTDNGFKGMKVRQEFPLGPNEDYLHSLFHIIQRTGNEGLIPVVRQLLEADENIENRQVVEQLLDNLGHGRPIEGRLSKGHYGVQFANFTKQEMLTALATQENAELRSGKTTA